MPQAVFPSAMDDLDMGGFLQQIEQVVGAVDCKTAAPAQPFACSLQRIQLGSIDLLKYDGSHLQRSMRSFRQVRDSWLDNFVASFPVTTHLALTQSGRRSVTAPGSTVLLSSSQPFDCRYQDHGNWPYTQIMIRIPGPLLRQRLPQVDHLCATPMAASQGAGKVLRHLVEGLIEECPHYSATQAVRYGELLLDAYVTLLQETPECLAAQPRQRPDTRAQLLAEAQAYIDAHLSDPELAPAQVAAHCRVSVRHLQTVFAAHGLNVAAFIRETRLQRCRESLRHPQLSQQPITATAMHWGFGSIATFNRVYRDRFGVSPSEDRAQSEPRLPH